MSQLHCKPAKQQGSLTRRQWPPRESARCCCAWPVVWRPPGCCSRVSEAERGGVALGRRRAASAEYQRQPAAGERAPSLTFNSLPPLTHACAAGLTGNLTDPCYAAPTTPACADFERGDDGARCSGAVACAAQAPCHQGPECCPASRVLHAAAEWAADLEALCGAAPYQPACALLEQCQVGAADAGRSRCSGCGSGGCRQAARQPPPAGTHPNCLPLPGMRCCCCSLARPTAPIASCLPWWARSARRPPAAPAARPGPRCAPPAAWWRSAPRRGRCPMRPAQHWPKKASRACVQHTAWTVRGLGWLGWGRACMRRTPCCTGWEQRGPHGCWCHAMHRPPGAP